MEKLKTMEWRYLNEEDQNGHTKHFLFEKIKNLVSEELENELNNLSITEIKIVVEDDKYSYGFPGLHSNDAEIKLGITYLSLLLRNCTFINSVILRDGNSCEETYKYSVLAALLHEVGHIVNNTKTTDEKEREILADKYENTIIYKLSKDNKSAIIGTLVSLFSMMEFDVLFGRNPSKEYDNHPSTLFRIEKFCSGVPTEFYNDVVEITGWGFRTFGKLRPSLGKIISKSVDSRFINSSSVSYVNSELDLFDDDEE